MNNYVASIPYVEAGKYIAIIAALCFLLILCFLIIIYVLQIRKQVDEINKTLNKLMALIGIEEKEERGKSIKNKQKLKLDDKDIEKLKNMGVGME